MITTQTNNVSNRFVKFSENRRIERNHLMVSGAFHQFDRFQNEVVPVLSRHIKEANSISIQAIEEGDMDLLKVLLVIAQSDSTDLTRAFERDETY